MLLQIRMYIHHYRHKTSVESLTQKSNKLQNIVTIDSNITHTLVLVNLNTRTQNLQQYT